MITEHIFDIKFHDYFNDFVQIFVGLASFSEAVTSFQMPRPPLAQHEPNQITNLHGRIISVSWQGYDVMHQVGRNEWPSQLRLLFVAAGLEPAISTGGVVLQNDAVTRIIASIVGNAFLKFYERAAPSIRTKYPGHPKTWPALLQFAWHIRNAIAHGDRFSIGDKSISPAIWRGIAISSIDNGRPWFDQTNYIGGGDIIALMKDISDHLQGDS